MKASNQPSQAADLVRIMLQHSYYSRRLRPYLPQVIDVANKNTFVRQTLQGILDRSKFATTGKVNLRRFRPERRLIEDFFEYIYFASPEFVERASYG